MSDDEVERELVVELADWLTTVGSCPPSRRLAALYERFSRSTRGCSARCVCEDCFVGYEHQVASE
jgi:hypothetical protein